MTNLFAETSSTFSGMTEEIKLLLYATNTVLIFYILRRGFDTLDKFTAKIGDKLDILIEQKTKTTTRKKAP